MLIYFVVLTIVGAFFAVNLALAVLYLHFTQSQAEIEIEKEQEAGKRISRHASAIVSNIPSFDTVPPSPTWWWRYRKACNRIQASAWFEGLTMVLISLNTVSMASEHHGMSDIHVKVRLASWLLRLVPLCQSQSLHMFCSLVRSTGPLPSSGMSVELVMTLWLLDRVHDAVQ